MTQAATQDISWDGWVYPYMPAGELEISGRLKLHEKVADEVDPFTHEVLRFGLWNVNVEHGNTMLKISGSPIAAFGHDFNPVILDERGDYVLFGPFLQYLSSATSSAVKWTLENRSENPGIEPGDMFLANDPWIASTHQPDVAVFAPVFIGDELFCWVGNTLHQWDLGGSAPGGFNPMAPDVFWEPPCIPPLKIVERGTLRRDLEELFTRFSRMPALVDLDLRALIAGVKVAGDRLSEMVTRYGAGAVKATMRKLQDDSEKSFVERLALIPDGTWTAEGWMEASQPGDRGVYKNRVTLTKDGDKLVFTNYGSAPQVGAINATFVAWRGAVVSMIVSQMLFDQMFVIEGALRHIEFKVEPGLITCAAHPASVSGAPAGTLLTTIGLGGLVISKMLAASSGEDLRSEVQSCMGALAYPIVAMGGVDQRGNPFASFFLDPVGAALAALNWRDGQDTGGWPWDLQSTMPNVEDNELFYPFLYLWRKELADSGGAGRFRGGNGAEFAIIPHKTDQMLMSTVTSELCIPGPGLFGGYPSSTNKYQVVRGANVAEQLSAGAAMPTSVDELEGESEWLGAKTFNNELNAGDVWITAWASASGYGDPLLRDPALIAEDVTAGRVTADWAEQCYGVVVGDAEATGRLREQRFTARLGKTPTVSAAAVESRHMGVSIAESLNVVDGWVIGPAGDRICPEGENYKEHLPSEVVPLTSANPHLRDPGIYTDAKVEVRNYYCPSSGILIESEIVVNDGPPLWDVRLGATDVEEARAL